RGAAARQAATGQRPVLRFRRLRPGARRHRAGADRAGAPVAAGLPRHRRGARRAGNRQEPLMELVVALAIGVLAGSGIWLLLRPRACQVIIGLSLLSYAVNLFIFGMGRLRVGAPPVLDPAANGDISGYADPLPQALVLTAIVISFAMTAL